MKQLTYFRPAFHKIHEDPKKNYGVGSVMCLMTLVGDKGAVSFSFSTGIYLPETWEYWEIRNQSPYTRGHSLSGMGYDVSYHSPVRQYEGQTPREDCKFLKGKKCYSDGSALLAEKWFDIFVAKGSDEIWKMLKKYYKEEFETTK